MLQRLSLRISTSSYRCSQVYTRSILPYISSHNVNTSVTAINNSPSSVSTINYSHYQALQQLRCIVSRSSIVGNDSLLATFIHQYSSTTTLQKVDDDNNNSTELNEFGHDYTQIGGPIDTYLCTLSETEIHERIRTRMHHKLKREYEQADRIQEELKQCGVILDRNRMWRADGSNSFPQTQLGRSRPVKSSNNNIKGGVGQIRKFSTSSGSYDVHGRGRFHGKRGGRKQLNEYGHDYTKVGGAIDKSICTLTETEINNMIRTRMQCRIKRDYQRADKIKEALEGCGVALRDDAKLWRADGEKSFPLDQMSENIKSLSLSNMKYTSKIPRMMDCRTLDDAIKAIYPNLDRVSPRDISAFWAVVPRLLRHQDQGAQLPKLQAIFYKTADQIHSYGPQDLTATTLGFAKTIQTLQRSKRVYGSGSYEEYLHGILIRQRDEVFDFIARTAVNKLDQFEPRQLKDLAYTYALMEFTPKLLEDGNTLFDHIAEKSIPLLDKFKPQELANIVWAFEKVKVQHPDLFEEMADHIVSLDHLNDFKPQELSNLLMAYAKAEESHLDLFNKVADHIVSLEHLNDFKPQELSNTIYAFAKAQLSHLDLFNKVADHIVSLDNLDGYNEQDVSNLAWAYHKAGIIRQDLNDKLIGDTVGRKGEFSSRKLNNLYHWTSEEEGIQNQEIDEDEIDSAAVDDENNENNIEDDEELEDDASVLEDLSLLTVVQLKDRLRNLGLPVSGRKHELIDRLNDHFQL